MIFSSGHYLEFRESAFCYYKSQKKKGCINFTQTDKQDEHNAIESTSMRIRLIQRKSTWRYTLNLYNTTCSALINGLNEHVFIETDLPEILKIVDKSRADAMNELLQKTLSSKQCKEEPNSNNHQIDLLNTQSKNSVLCECDDNDTPNSVITSTGVSEFQIDDSITSPNFSPSQESMNLVSPTSIKPIKVSVKSLDVENSSMTESSLVPLELPPLDYSHSSLNKQELTYTPPKLLPLNKYSVASACSNVHSITQTLMYDTPRYRRPIASAIPRIIKYSGTGIMDIKNSTYAEDVLIKKSTTALKDALNEKIDVLMNENNMLSEKVDLLTNENNKLKLELENLSIESKRTRVPNPISEPLCSDSTHATPIDHHSGGKCEQLSNTKYLLQSEFLILSKKIDDSAAQMNSICSQISKLDQYLKMHKPVDQNNNCKLTGTRNSNISDADQTSVMKSLIKDGYTSISNSRPYMNRRVNSVRPLSGVKNVVLSSSMLKDLSPKRLDFSGNTEVRSISGAGVNDMYNYIARVGRPMTSVKSVLLLIGSNDCSNLSLDALPALELAYDDLISILKVKFPLARISFLELLPRFLEALPREDSVFNDRVKDVNKVLKRVCTSNNCDLIKTSHYFFQSNGGVKKYLYVDHTHLNARGVGYLAFIVKQVFDIQTPKRSPVRTVPLPHRYEPSYAFNSLSPLHASNWPRIQSFSRSPPQFPYQLNGFW
ncbi:hypothetical protein SNE40_010629 [Patella caerulea]|uniref:SGNH hydrolase-type esterase domain-containing protein n=1 Tax=Patella caerulea TaxID=87958 RepID=A0AAN8K1F2_PATCE